MTRAVIYVQVGEVHQIKYQDLKSTPEVTFFDLDNHSDAYLIRLALRLVEESEKVLIALEVSSESSQMGQLSSFLNSVLRKHRNKIALVYSGSHEGVGKFSTAFRGEPIHPDRLSEFIYGWMSKTSASA